MIFNVHFQRLYLWLIALTVMRLLVTIIMMHMKRFGGRSLMVGEVCVIADTRAFQAQSAARRGRQQR